MKQPLVMGLVGGMAELLINPVTSEIYDTCEYPLDYPTGQLYLEVTAA